MCLEGQISRESVTKSLGRGEAPSGDLIPWTLTQQFQEPSFPTLSGARIVRVAVHPDMHRMGYGSRAVDQLIHYFQGDLPSKPLTTGSKAAAKAAKAAKAEARAAAEAADADGGGLLTEAIAPRAELPPLLLSLSQRPPERLHWLGTSFGLTQTLYAFWHRLGFKPAYVRQTVNDVTGEHTAIVVRALEDADHALPAATRVAWASDYASDFRRRFTSLLGLSLRSMSVHLALSILDPQLQPPPGQPVAAPSSEQLEYVLGPYDLRRLQSYANNLADHHLVADLVPTLASLRFTGRLTTPLSHVQAAILLGMGLQHKPLDDVATELSLPASQLLALFNKAVRKLVSTLRGVVEAKEAESLPHTAADAEAAAGALRPLEGESRGGLDAELERGAAASLRKLEADTAAKQQAWLDEVGDGGGELARYTIQGTDDEWTAALGGAAPPKHVSLKGARSPADEKKLDAPSSGGGGGSDKKKKKKGDGDGGRAAKRRKS